MLRGTRHLFHGGYQGAERKCLIFLPSYLSAEEWKPDSTILALRVEAPFPPKPLTHRDYLGSLLALQIKRECVGDILVRERGADVLLLNTVAQVIQEQWQTVGRAKIQCERLSLSEVFGGDEREERMRVTVSSLRLDAAAAACFSVSRGRMSCLIEQGAVKVNWSVCLHKDGSVSEGDVISVRGMGRARLDAVGGLSLKGRVFLEIIRYV